MVAATGWRRLVPWLSATSVWFRAAFLVVVLHALIAWLAHNPGVSVGNDDALYLFLRNALQMFRYQDIYLHVPIPHVQYPPGWPAMLAVYGLATGNSIGAAFILPPLLTGASLLLLFLVGRRLGPEPWAFVLLLIVGFGVPALWMGGWIFAEAAYLFFSMLAIWAVSSGSRSPGIMALAGASALAAAYVRTIGIALLVAVILVWMLDRRWRAALSMVVVAALGFGPWMAWTLFGPQRGLGRSYGGDLSATVPGSSVGILDATLTMAGKAMRRLFGLLGQDIPAILPFLRIQGLLIDNLLWVLVALVVGGAGCWHLWRRCRIAPVYLALYLGVLILWTWQRRRLLYPVQPLVWLTLFSGILVLRERVGRWGGWVATGVLLVAIPLQLVPDSWNLVARGVACDRARQYESPTCHTPEQLGFFAAARYARDSLPPGVVLADREAAFAWHSGRTVEHSIEWVRGVEPDRVLEGLRNAGVTYILLAALTPHDQFEMPALLAPRCHELRVVRTFGEETVLLELRTDGTGDSCELLRGLEERGRQAQERPR